MPFSKGVAGKAFHLAPYFCNFRVRTTLSTSVCKKLILNILEFLTGSEFSRHASAQDVGLCERESAVVVRHFDDVFLVDHNAVGIREQFQKCGNGVLPAFRVAVAQDVLAHHAAGGNARPDDGTCGDQIHVALGLQLLHEHAHGR